MCGFVRVKGAPPVLGCSSYTQTSHGSSLPLLCEAKARREGELFAEGDSVLIDCDGESTPLLRETVEPFSLEAVGEALRSVCRSGASAAVSAAFFSLTFFFFNARRRSFSSLLL